MKKLILVTGGNGRFAKILKENNKLLNLKFLSKKELNILDSKSIEKCFSKIKNLIEAEINSDSKDYDLEYIRRHVDKLTS